MSDLEAAEDANEENMKYVLYLVNCISPTLNPLQESKRIGRCK
jgi:hypothetical protein